MAKKKNVKVQLIDMLKEYLGRPVTVSLLREIDEERLEGLEAGDAVPTVAEMLVEKVIKYALDPKKPNLKFVELVFERVEGRATQGMPVMDDGRSLEERLNGIEKEHFNSIARQFSQQRKEERGADQAKEDSTGPANRILDLPDNRAGGPKKATVEPSLEEGTAKAG